MDPGRIELPSQGESTEATTCVVRVLSRLDGAHGRATPRPPGCYCSSLRPAGRSHRHSLLVYVRPGARAASRPSKAGTRGTSRQLRRESHSAVSSWVYRPFFSEANEHPRHASFRLLSPVETSSGPSCACYFIARRRRSRAISRFLIDARLSWTFLPLPRPISNLANPSLKYRERGTSVSPRSAVFP